MNLYSGRGPGVGGKKHRGEEEDDDASKDAEESSQDHSIIQEVNLKPSAGALTNSNPSNSSRSKDSEMQPIKGGVVLDLDEDGEKGDDSQAGRGQDSQENKDDGQVIWRLLNTSVFFIVVFPGGQRDGANSSHSHTQLRCLV
jgi:hypothetical protein